MTASIIEQHHAIGRRQYSLLMQRELRKSARQLRRINAAELFRRGLEGFAFVCSVAVFSLALAGWMGV